MHRLNDFAIEEVKSQIVSVFCEGLLYYGIAYLKPFSCLIQSSVNLFSKESVSFERSKTYTAWQEMRIAGDRIHYLISLQSVENGRLLKRCNFLNM